MRNGEIRSGEMSKPKSTKLKLRNEKIVRAYDVNFMMIFGIIVIKLIPLLGGPTGSLEPPRKMVAVGLMEKLSFWATPFYLYFQPGTKTINHLRIGVETNMRALK